MSTLQTGAAATADPAAAQNILYTHLVDPRTVAISDDALIQCIRLHGIATQTANDDMLLNQIALLNAIWQQLAAPDFALWVSTVKTLAQVAPRAAGDGIADELEQRWCASLDGALFDVAHYVSVVQRRPRGLLGRALKTARQAGHFKAPLNRRLERLSGAVRVIAAQLAQYEPHILAERVDDEAGRCSEPLEFLGLLINGTWRPMRLPRAHLAEALPCVEPFFGDFRDQVMALRGPTTTRHGAVLSLQKYSGAPHPGRLDAFLGLPYELVITHSMAMQDETAALEVLNQRIMHGEDAEEASLEDLEKLIVGARNEVSGGRTARGYHQMTATLYTRPFPTGDLKAEADSHEALRRAVEAANAVFTRGGLTAVRESAGLETQWWSRLPGHDDYAARAQGTISTVNLACYAPLTGFRAAAPSQHWGTVTTFPALHIDPKNPAGVMGLRSGVAWPFAFHNGPGHEPPGHALMIAPTNGGKTVLMLLLYWLAWRYLGMRGRYFDCERGAETGILALGGQYDVIRPGLPSGLAPSLLPDSPEARAYLRRLLGLLISGNRLERLTTAQSKAIQVAVDALYTLPVEARSFTALRQYTSGKVSGDGDPFRLLAPWVAGGEFAWLFDNPQETLALDATALGWDFTSIKDERVAYPLTDYLFKRIKDDIAQGSRTGLFMDEGWKFLELFPEEIPALAATVRRADGLLYFATNRAKELVESDAGKGLIENIKTKWILPNETAKPEVYIDGLGLTPEEFHIIKHMPETSRCVLLMQGGVSTVLRIDLSAAPDLLRVMSRPSDAVDLARELMAEHGPNPQLWLPHYIEQSAREVQT